jgi:hypothetical protein
MDAPDPSPPALTERFLAAVALAAQVHGRDRRTGTEIPYVAHLLVVTGLVIEDGGDEDQAIAALLHDAVEDGGGRELLARIERSFGAHVAAIVAALSDSIDIDPQEPWIQRKARYLEHLADEHDDAILRVALADKVHNARSIVRDYRENGRALWERFTQKTARQQLWYYGGLLEFFEERRPGALTEDLWRAVGELAWLVAHDEAQQSGASQLWVDPDLHRRQAPEGWIQVRSAGEAIQLLDEFDVEALSLGGSVDEVPLNRWLDEHASAGEEHRLPGRIERH